MNNYKICTRCVMDTSDPTIKFDENGYCNYCSDALARMKSEYHPEEQGKAQFDSLMKKAKEAGIGKKYDCMVGVSGGIDSSYLVYLGHQYGLRMLCVHIDDGLDTYIATTNLNSLCAAAHSELLIVKPDMEQYKNVIRSFFLARVPNLAFAQDNILLGALKKAAKENDIMYSLSGANFSMESILQKNEDMVYVADKSHIHAIHKLYGTAKTNKLCFSGMVDQYIGKKYFSSIRTVYPLNYIDYRLDTALAELKTFSGFEYYGGKHYESILTRFMQCWYLPIKYNFDKRRSHFSSLIVSGQMTREEAINKMKLPLYPTKEMYESDVEYLAQYIGMTRSEFDDLMKASPKQHSDYSSSPLNKLAPIARKFRKILG